MVPHMYIWSPLTLYGTGIVWSPMYDLIFQDSFERGPLLVLMKAPLGHHEMPGIP